MHGSVAFWSDTELSLNDLGLIQTEVFKARTKWYDIGLALKVDVSTLDSIDGQFDNHGDKLRETLKSWLRTSTELTWQAIVNALKSPAVAHSELAENIEVKKIQLQEYKPTIAELQAENHCLRQAIQQARAEIEELEHVCKSSSRQLQELSELQQTTKAQHPLIKPNTIQDMKWQEQSKAPEKMFRGSATSDANVAYFNGRDSKKIHSYNSDTQKWDQPRIPNTPHTKHTLVTVKDMLTIVGGSLHGKATNSILSLKLEGRKRT